MGRESHPGGEIASTPCGDVDSGREKRPGKPTVAAPGRDRATCRAQHRCQGSGRAWGEHRWEGRGKNRAAPRRSRLLPTGAVRSVLTTPPPCAGAWREPRARECAAPVRATGAHVGLAQAASWGQAVAASRADRQAPSKRRDALAMLLGQFRTCARGDIQSRRGHGKLRPSLQHVGQLVRVATFDGPARSCGKAANQPGGCVNQNWCSCQSLWGEIHTPRRGGTRQGTSKGSGARACTMVGCAERKCTSRLERYRRSDIAGSLPVELRRSEKFV